MREEGVARECTVNRGTDGQNKVIYLFHLLGYKVHVLTYTPPHTSKQKSRTNIIHSTA